jgi:small subunit ribosomal protein S21
MPHASGDHEGPQARLVSSNLPDGLKTAFAPSRISLETKEVDTHKIGPNEGGGYTPLHPIPEMLMNVTVFVRDGDLTKALRRFKKACERELVLSDMRRAECYRKPSVKRQLKQLRARKRARKALLA